VTTILVGNGVPQGVAITPDGKHVYVTLPNFNVSPGTVAVIDTANNKVVAKAAVGANPFGVAVTPDGKHAYVANGGVNIDHTTLSR
jgi:YVTN family beta-propeller protein